MFKFKSNTLIKIKTNTLKKSFRQDFYYRFHIQLYDIRFFFSKAILAFVPILCELLISNYPSNRKILKFHKEITKATMLKYVIMNYSCEFLARQ